MKKGEANIFIGERTNKALDVYVALERITNPKLTKKQATEDIILSNAKIKSLIKKHKIKV
jgi:hypothetical protein